MFTQKCAKIFSWYLVMILSSTNRLMMFQFIYINYSWCNYISMYVLHFIFFITQNYVNCLLYVQCFTVETSGPILMKFCNASEFWNNCSKLEFYWHKITQIAIFSNIITILIRFQSLTTQTKFIGRHFYKNSGL